MLKVEFAILSFSSVSVPSFHVINTYVRASPRLSPELACCLFRRETTRCHFPSASSCFRRSGDELRGVYPRTNHIVYYPPIGCFRQIMLASAARHVAALSGSSRSSAWRSAAAAVPSVGSHASFSTQSNDDDVYSEEDISHYGEWAGCTRRFLPPIKIAVRGSEILTNPLCECCAAEIPPTIPLLGCFCLFLRVLALEC